MKLGARIFKTGIAIIVALLIAHQINGQGAIVLWYLGIICNATQCV